MIWFLCKKCGKRHGRADNLAGTMIFCDCSFGNTVPWQSTTTAPETPPEPPPRPLPPPPRPRPFDDREDRPPPRPRPFDDRDERLPPRPFPFDDRDLDRGRDRPPPPPPPDDASAGDLLRRRKAHVFRRRRPGFCLNHDDVATEKTCADCKEAFCPNCIVELQGQTLCGPCKNFRIRGLHRPGRVPGLAVVALIVGLAGGPVAFCLTLFGAGPKGSPLTAVILSLVCLVLPVGGLVVSWMALREIETKPNLGGRGLAMTGATTSLVGVLWCLTVAFLVLYKMSVG